MLQLKPRPEVPDQVHIVLELAKGFDPFPVAEDTQFDAKKDAEQVDVIFKSENEIVVNKATLDEEGLKTVFQDISVVDRGEGQSTFVEITTVHAASDADGLDVNGNERQDASVVWATLGNDRMPQPEMGFAIASPMLQVAEGNRTIRLIFAFENLDEVIESILFRC